MDEGIVALIGLFFLIPVVVLLVVYFMRKFAHIERMKAIESGANLSNIIPEKSSTTGKYYTLRFGLLLIGGGIGLLTGILLQNLLNIPDPAGVFSMLAVFGGAGLIVAYIIENKKEGEE